MCPQGYRRDIGKAGDDDDDDEEVEDEEDDEDPEDDPDVQDIRWFWSWNILKGHAVLSDSSHQSDQTFKVKKYNF